MHASESEERVRSRHHDTRQTLCARAGPRAPATARANAATARANAATARANAATARANAATARANASKRECVKV